MTENFLSLVSAFLPSGVSYYTILVRTANGSSQTGHCEDAWQLIGVVACSHPETSVLFDGNIPTLTGLDGDTWAAQLLTLNTSNLASLEEKKAVLRFNFAKNNGRLEMVLFNCPEWGIATSRITIQTEQDGHLYNYTKAIDPTLTSCDSLVRVCIPIETKHFLGTLKFESPPGSSWTHLAEVTFYANTPTCPPDIVLNHPTTPSPFPSTSPTAVTTGTTQRATDHTAPENINHTSTGNTGHTLPSHTPSRDINPTLCPCGDPQCGEVCPSPSSLATILGSSIPLTILAIMTTVIFTVSVVAVCKYRSKFKVRYDRAQLIEEGEGQEEEGDREEGEEEEEHMYEEVGKWPYVLSSSLSSCTPGIDPFSSKWTF